MSVPSSKTKIYGVRASIADLARSFAVLANMALSRDWLPIDPERLAAARRKSKRTSRPMS